MPQRSYNSDSMLVVMLGLMLGFTVKSSSATLDSLELDPVVLCNSRCLAKCFTEHGSTNTDFCGHCSKYDAGWLQQTCNNTVCQEACEDLAQNPNDSVDRDVPAAPILQMSVGMGSFVFTWEHDDQYAVYLLQGQIESFPWMLLEQTTDSQFELTDLATPRCTNVTKQIRVIAVNQYGASPTSNGIHLEDITAAENFRYVDGAVSHKDPEYVSLTFTWTNIPGWPQIVGRYSVSVIRYSDCGHGVIGQGASSKASGPGNRITISIPKIAVSNNCNYTFELHNDDCCYSIKPLTKVVMFDCSDFEPSLCIPDKPTKTYKVEPQVTSYLNHSALVSWTIPVETAIRYDEILVRWGEVEKSLRAVFPYIIEDEARNTSVSVTSSSLLLINLEPGLTYGVQVALNIRPDILPFKIMPTTTFDMPPDLPTDVPTTSAETSLIYLNTYRPANIQGVPQNTGNLIAIGVVGTLVISALAVVFCVCYFKYQHNDMNKMAITQEEESINNIYSTSPNSRLQHQSRPSICDRWEIPYDHIETGDILGQGAFGKVIKGKIEGRILTHRNSDSTIVSESMKSHDVEVAVKMLHEYAEDSQKQEFLREILLMKNLGYHANVVSLIACCTRQEPLCLVVEHCNNGDLLNFLRSRRPHYYQGGYSEQSDECLSASELMSFARQIVLGMEYLSQKGFVHRDLAARNVLVMEDKTMKIGDFGLTRFVYDDKVYVHRNGGRLPIKWMSIESVFDQVFTTKSDVWSFGIVLFEIISLGSAPYPGVSNHDIPKFLKRGYRMDRPDGSSEELYAIMKSCWRPFQEDRPSFTDLRYHLENILEQDTPYLDLGFSMDIGVLPEDSSSSQSDSSSVGSNLALDTVCTIETDGLAASVREGGSHLGNHSDRADEEMKPMLIMSVV